MRFWRVEDWLAWLETLHPRAIDPGLERIAAVAARMELERPEVPVITVAGTNGKGSTVAALVALANAAGLRVGAYTSPHVLEYNERISVAGEPVSDDLLLEAFDAIDCARGGITLSYFEFGTLAALWCFRHSACDLWVLEVGLGGRLDATNVVAPDVAVITHIGLDHTEWLGPDREAIGREKAGILRHGIPLVCADPDPPASVREAAHALTCPFHGVGEAFCVEREAGGGWAYADADVRLPALPAPADLPTALLANPAAAVAALRRLGQGLPGDAAAVARALDGAVAPARFQSLGRRVPWIVDVAHNLDSARMLAERLRRGAAEHPGRVHAVFAIMARKDAGGVVAALRDVVDIWHLLELDDPDARQVDDLRALLGAAGARIGACAPASTLMEEVDRLSLAGDRVVAFGSFRVAEEVLRAHAGLLP
ncbi:bifunctional folylpolyglutamate synthase/dihydrofolate synthase [Arhodomonas sp. SL1]|uniref:bifunctional folylpolyglutamate synthase/dihydrofolate synthase n=1 Tax=Arhodomonas sp. SL1 TaxID=3425691 RepID=UPI003F882BE7